MSRWIDALRSGSCLVGQDGVDLPVICRGVVPFIVIQLVGLAVIFNWETLVTWLPAQAYGIR